MKVYRNPDVLWREEDEEKARVEAGMAQGDDVGDMGVSVLFADGIMLSLNILGTEIWKRCDGRTEAEIVAELVEQFEADPAVVKEDARQFLLELEAKGFIRYEE